MARIAILFDDSDVQVQRIAHRIADILRGRGQSVYVSDLRSLLDTFSLRSYDGALLGGRIRFGRVPKRLRDFAKENAALLARIQAWLFSLHVGEPKDNSSALRRFHEETGWAPQRIWSFQGAGFLSKDPQAIDWHSVRAFTLAFAERVEMLARQAGADTMPH